jgi:hypothetical protein
VRAAAAALTVVLALTACDDDPAPVKPLTLAWQSVTMPAGGTVADLAYCAGRWYAAGTASGRPTAWTTTDFAAWTPVALTATTPYGTQGSFVSVACQDTAVAALGSATGGIHGNPRVSTWRSRPDGGWTEVEASGYLFGGQTSGSVDRMLAGPHGWLIVGHRVSPSTNQRGAAVWFAADGATFQLVDDDPALRSTAQGFTTAYDAAAVGDGWVLVGSAGSAIDPKPAAWASDDGLHWRKATVESSRPGAVERVVAYPRGGFLGVGDGYGWLATENGHDALDQMGRTCDGPVASLTAADRTAVAVTGTVLCASVDGINWREVTPPGPPPEGGALRAVAGGGRLVVTSRASLWTTDATAITP